MSEKIVIQREQLEKGNPKIDLHSSCRIDDGILLFGNKEREEFASAFDAEKTNKEICFFVPASGSGSRMFGFLYDYLNSFNASTQTIVAIEKLIQRIEDFAFYSKLPSTYKEQLENGEVDIKGLIELILTSKGFDYGSLPKGLIPFHLYGGVWKNPFQEHLEQGRLIGSDQSEFHFTINKKFEKDIKGSIEYLERSLGQTFNLSFSEQDSETDSFAFGENMSPIKTETGAAVMRPAGHGALIGNLNSISADIIFIRNIDNIQHANKSRASISYRKALGGALLAFQTEVFGILREIDSDFDPDKVRALNNRYDLRMPEVIIADADLSKSFLNRPIRLCGMVKNEGQAGGGPFWVENEKGQLSRQIVEKAQISSENIQLDILIKSTHFNPVEVVCGVKDYRGQKFDLKDFIRQDQYFIVNKTYKGKAIRYIEQPGLWNGAMANWITLFYEIDSSCFSPVKTVLDLLEDPHRP